MEDGKPSKRSVTAWVGHITVDEDAVVRGVLENAAVAGQQRVVSVVCHRVAERINESPGFDRGQALNRPGIRQRVRALWGGHRFSRRRLLIYFSAVEVELFLSLLAATCAVGPRSPITTVSCCVSHKQYHFFHTYSTAWRVASNREAFGWLDLIASPPPAPLGGWWWFLLVVGV